MKNAFDEVEKKIISFLDDGEYNHFNSSINCLYDKLIHAYPKISGVKLPLAELQSYSYSLASTKTSKEHQKYYQLCIGRLNVLETKTELAGVLSYWKCNA